MFVFDFPSFQQSSSKGISFPSKLNSSVTALMAEINRGDKLMRLTPAGESDEEKLLFIEQMTENCDQVQQQVLAEILAQNGETEYLRRHGLGGATDRSTFKSKIPVVTYEDLQPDILRIANGDASAILSGHPITEFLISSGTSGGESKLIPVIEQDFFRRRLFNSFWPPIINQFLKGSANGLALLFMFIKPESQTPAGLPVRSLSTSNYKNNILNPPPNPSNISTSPPAAVLCPDIRQSMYIQMLSGILHRLEVDRIGTVFASGLVRAIHFLETSWPQLAHDITTGTLSPSITHPSLRSSVAGLLRPDPELARLITDECSKPDRAGIITRIWPHTMCLIAIVTGTMAQYIPALELYGGGLPIVSRLYGSSECLSAINLAPICHHSQIAYTIMPNTAYFELLAEGEKSDPIDLADAEIGKEYELVLTTYAGLCRYRVGDMLKVSGFINTAPQFRFVRRKNMLLSIDSDKTNEVELQRAIKNAAEVLLASIDSVSLADYTSHGCTETVPGHYVIYWELRWRGEERSSELGEVMKRCCLAMEEELNSVYRHSRVVDGSIGPLEIRVIRAGTFEEVMNLAVSNGATIGQYKVPRCVGSKPTLELLDSRVVSTHFSPSLPRWSPRHSF